MRALCGVDLAVSSGEVICIIGPSGCGKSTLLYLVAGLEDLTGGTIESHGVPVSAPDSDRSLIFQESSLYPWLSVVENVTFGLKLRGMAKAERRKVAGELLNKVGLGGFAGKRPDELSGGMRQRAAVARALAMEPSVLLMDEPFAALDVQTRSKLQDFLIQVWRDSGASVLFVTHHIDEAMALADRVVVMTARPTLWMAASMASLTGTPCCRCPRYWDSRWMVSSTAIPRTMALMVINTLMGWSPWRNSYWRGL